MCHYLVLYVDVLRVPASQDRHDSGLTMPMLRALASRLKQIGSIGLDGFMYSCDRSASLAEVNDDVSPTRALSDCIASGM